MRSKPNKSMMDFVPGMDFVQQLFKSAPGIAQSLPPSLSQWIAPTTSVEEIDKKIADLRAVQSWLETNTAMLKATVQALEVQRMTISTLKSLKVNLAELPGSTLDAAKEAASEIKEKPLDPLQWWGVLSKQMAQPFAALDTQAMQQTAMRTAQAMAKSAASGVAAGAANAAMDAAFGMADKGFKTAQSLAKSALSVNKNKASKEPDTHKRSKSIAKKNKGDKTYTSKSMSKTKSLGNQGD